MFLNGNVSSGIFMVKMNVNGFLSKIRVTEHFNAYLVISRLSQIKYDKLSVLISELTLVKILIKRSLLLCSVESFFIVCC